MVKERVKCPFEGCEKDYLNRCNLKRHINFHHLKKAFVCPVCHKGLSSRQNRDEHMNSHTGAKPYKCPFIGCLETFRQASQLSIHKKLHRMIHEHSYQGSSIQRDSFELPSEWQFTIPFTRLPLPRNSTLS